MAAYKDLVGQKITVVTSNPPEPKTGQMWYNSTDGVLRGLGILEAFTSAPNLPSISFRRTGFGVQTAGVIAGGSSTSTNRLTVTEEYNGSGYSVGGSLNEGRRLASGAGTQTAGLFYLGAGPSSDTDVSTKNESYDGSSFSEVGDLTTARQGAAGDGTQIAAFAAAGSIAPGPSAAAETWDGSSWTNLPSVNTTRRFLSGSGSPSAAVIFGGEVNPSGPSDTRKATEEYNGSSWTTVTNMNSGAGALASSGGAQTDVISFAGRRSTTVNNAEAYDGTTWSASPATLATSRSMVAGLGSGTAALCVTGETQPGPYTNVSEEYNKSTNTITAAAWAAGGTVPYTSRQNMSFGTQTAAIACGGYVSTTLNTSVSYDGTSYSGTPNLNVAARLGGVAGTQAAGLEFGGIQPPGTYNANMQSWNGSSWSNSPYNLNSGSYGIVGCGTQTAALRMGGENPSGGDAWNLTEEYDGSGWTAGNTMPAGKYSGAGDGTQTSAFIAGGSPSPTSTATYEYDGTNWTAGGSLITSRGAGSGASGESVNSGLIFGGAPAQGDTEGYDGTSWSTRPPLGTGRSWSTGNGTATAALMVSGGPPSGTSTATEEFTGETETANIADFATS